MPDDKLTPSEYLMLEVLIARMRLGESCWTFESRHAKTAKKLEERGLVDWKSGIVEDTILVFPSDVLRRPPYMSEGYVPPVLREVLSGFDAFLTGQSYLCTACLGTSPYITSHSSSPMCRGRGLELLNDAINKARNS